MAVARAEGIRRFLLYSASQDVEGILAFYRAHGFRPWAATQLFQ